jgi:hypothetical protein
LLGSNVSNAPPADLYASNPEWFWPRDDPAAYGQLCWTNSSLVSFMTEQVKTFLAASPEATIISVSQNDNGNFCNTTEEWAVIEEEGSPIGPLLRAVNTIADAIAEDFPHVAVDTLAYQCVRAQVRPRQNERSEHNEDARMRRKRVTPPAAGELGVAHADSSLSLAQVHAPGARQDRAPRQRHHQAVQHRVQLCSTAHGRQQ